AGGPPMPATHGTGEHDDPLASLAVRMARRARYWRLALERTPPPGIATSSDRTMQGGNRSTSYGLAVKATSPTDTCNRMRLRGRVSVQEGSRTPAQGLPSRPQRQARGRGYQMCGGYGAPDRLGGSIRTEMNFRNKSW